MATRTLGLNETVHRYVIEIGLREPDVLRRVREETLPLAGAHMQIAPEQGQLMAFLARLAKSHHYLEIGTFTGYSAMALALALPSEGRVTTCEIDESFADIARQHWQRAGVPHKIDLKLGPALATLDRILAEGGAERFDMAFIDADKENILAYYERCRAFETRRSSLDRQHLVEWRSCGPQRH